MGPLSRTHSVYIKRKKEGREEGERKEGKVTGRKREVKEGNSQEEQKRERLRIEWKGFPT